MRYALSLLLIVWSIGSAVAEDNKLRLAARDGDVITATGASSSRSGACANAINQARAMCIARRFTILKTRCDCEEKDSMWECVGVATCEERDN